MRGSVRNFRFCYPLVWIKFFDFLFRFRMEVYIFSAPAKEVGEASERSFEMVLFPARTADLKVYLHSENFKLHLLALSAHQIHYLIPPPALKFDAQLRCA